MLTPAVESADQHGRKRGAVGCFAGPGEGMEHGGKISHGDWKWHAHQVVVAVEIAG